MELYNDKILMVIVTFNPEIKFLNTNLKKNINTDILVIDNNSANKNQIFDLVNLHQNCTLIINKTNLGIAEALNQGLLYAQEKEYKYILTMDQDSSFKNNFFKLREGFLLQENVAVVCPSVIDSNSHNKDFAKEKFEEVFIAITSGCLCDVKALKEVGGFNNDLFIDYVDFEICIKLQLRKYKILRSKEVILNHSLGFSKSYSLFGIKFVSTNHNELRRFYNARNRVFLAKKYFKYYPKFFIKNWFALLKTIFIILLLEGNKWSKLKSISKGILQGIKLK